MAPANPNRTEKEIRACKWNLFDLNGMSVGFIESRYKDHYRAYVNYGPTKSFESMQDAVTFIENEHPKVGK